MISSVMKKKILIIDDEALIRMMVKKDLEQMGYVVETASSGNEGWEDVISFRPDLVITDLNMPGMYGLELLEKIRTNDATKDLPVLCITSESDIDVKQRAVLLKATGWVQKPFNPQTWGKALRQILG